MGEGGGRVFMCTIVGRTNLSISSPMLLSKESSHGIKAKNRTRDQLWCQQLSYVTPLPCYAKSTFFINAMHLLGYATTQNQNV